MSWLALEGTTDRVFRTLFVFLGILVAVYYSSLMERPYHQKLATLYLRPWW